jgi:hypothetical protein
MPQFNATDANNVKGQVFHRTIFNYLSTAILSVINQLESTHAVNQKSSRSHINDL